jgi:hypothetical protein
MIPDPAGLWAVNPWNPQTWNRYAYVGNNPVTCNDPSGLKRDLGWTPGGGGGFTGLYMQTGGSSYNNWVNTFIQSQINAGFVQNGPQNPIYSYQNSNMEFKAFGASATIVGGDNDSGLNASVDSIDATGGGQAGYWYVSGYSRQDIGGDDNLIAQNQPSQGPQGPPRPSIPRPPNPILKYDRCATAARNQAARNRDIVTGASAFGSGLAFGGCGFTGPGIPLCAGTVEGLDLLVEGVNQYGYYSSVYDHETQCMQE